MEFRTFCLLALLIGASTLAAAAPAAPPAAVSAADEVIALTKAMWADELQSPPNLAHEYAAIADDYTELNETYATRIDGKSTMIRLHEAGLRSSVKQIASEMLNPKVQVYGDVAILSYNFSGLMIDKDGKTEATRGKSTRVYVKMGGKWMLVHANFGADPLPK